jgi:hypothetical protein
MVVKPMEMRRARHMAHMREIQKAYKILVIETWAPPGVFFSFKGGSQKMFAQTYVQAKQFCLFQDSSS